MSTFEGTGEVQARSPEAPFNSSKFARVVVDKQFFKSLLPAVLRTLPKLTPQIYDAQSARSANVINNMMKNFLDNGSVVIEQVLFERYGTDIAQKMPDGSTKKLKYLTDGERNMWRGRLLTVPITKDAGIEAVSALLRLIQIPNISRGPLKDLQYNLQQAKGNLPETFLGRLSPEEKQRLGITDK